MARIIEFHIPAGFKPKIQMIVVSQELLAALKEARRVSAQGLTLGTYLRSQAEAAVDQESEAHMQLLRSIPMKWDS